MRGKGIILKCREFEEHEIEDLGKGLCNLRTGWGRCGGLGSFCALVSEERGKGRYNRTALHEVNGQQAKPRPARRDTDRKHEERP